MDKYAFLEGYMLKKAEDDDYSDVVKAQRKAQLFSVLAPAVGWGTVGGIYGAARDKSKGESRVGAIARSGARGAAAGAGGSLGALAASKISDAAGWNPVTAPYKRLAAMLAGNTIGGLAGYTGAKALTPTLDELEKDKENEEYAVNNA